MAVKSFILLETTRSFLLLPISYELFLPIHFFRPQYGGRLIQHGTLGD